VSGWTANFGNQTIVHGSFPACCIQISLPQTGTAATLGESTDVDMTVVAGQDPFEYIIEGLDQISSEPAGFDVRVSALNSAGYGRPSASLNIKVRQTPKQPEATLAVRCHLVSGISETKQLTNK